MIRDYQPYIKGDSSIPKKYEMKKRLSLNINIIKTL